jgi:hypothetical protein
MPAQRLFALVEFGRPPIHFPRAGLEIGAQS